MTDDTGIFQHAKFGVPDRMHGYTTDDNARALIAAVRWHRGEGGGEALPFVSLGLAFLYHAQSPDGRFRNFMRFDRQFVPGPGSEDCSGRAFWALGETVVEPSIPLSLRHVGWEILSRGLAQVETLTSPRAQAYALLGLNVVAESADWRSVPPVNGMVSQIQLEATAHHLGAALYAQYQAYRGSEWHWFEDSLTYGNAVLPWALLEAAGDTHSDWTQSALEALAFLTARTFTTSGVFKPIGTQGWLTRGGVAAAYDEQPLEACEMLLACQAAYRRVGRKEYRDWADACYYWYLGRNSVGRSLIDAETGGCCDGIDADGLNRNQGAESILSFLIAHWARDEAARGQVGSGRPINRPIPGESGASTIPGGSNTHGME